MSTMIDHAKSELNLLMGQFKADPEVDQRDLHIQEDLHKAVLQIVQAISEQGLSGGTFDTIMGMVNVLARLDPLTPVVDTPDQWEDRSGGYLQHKRCSRLMRYAPSGKTIDVEGIKLVERSGACLSRPNDEITFPFLPSEKYKVGEQFYATYDAAMAAWEKL